MIDYFALLEEPRRPWIEEAVIKERFQKKSAAFHPDRFHSATNDEKLEATRTFEQLNAACRCLSDSKARIQHLLELETGAKPDVVEQVDEDIMSLFLKVGQVLHQVDRFLADRDAIESPLLKVAKFQEGMDWAEKLKALLAEIRVIQESCRPELERMNDAWMRAQEPSSARALPLADLERVYRRISHASRWINQLQEQIMRLQIS